MTTPATKGPLLSGAAREAVMAYLQANLNNVIALKDQAPTTGVVLEPIPSSSYYISDSFDPLKFPALFVLMKKLKFNWTPGPNWINGEHELQIVIVAEEMGADRLQQKVEGYERVLFDTLDQVSVADPAGRIQLKLVSDQVEFSDTFEKRMTEGRKCFRKSVVYSFKALHYENRSIP